MNEATRIALNHLQATVGLENIERPVYEMMSDFLKPSSDSYDLIQRALAVFLSQINYRRIDFEIEVAKIKGGCKRRGLQVRQVGLEMARDEQDLLLQIQVTDRLVLDYRMSYGVDWTARVWEGDFKARVNAPAFMPDGITCTPAGLFKLVNYLRTVPVTSLSIARACAITGGRHDLTPRIDIVREELALLAVG